MITIIDYKAGNIRSVENALKRLNAPYIVSNDAKSIMRAEKIIFPGVGSAGDAMKRLNDFGLVDVISSCTCPFLGICLGMQLLYEYSEEDDTELLGIFPGRVKLLPSTEKVPHMGWNNVATRKDSLLTKDISPDDYFYFVHSYYAPRNQFTVGTTDYAVPFSSVVQKDNFFGTQFHPEKSAESGEKLLKNFISL